MQFALSPNLAIRGLIPNMMQWQGPLPGAGGGAATPTSGNNYLFTATQLLIKNVETNRYYVLFVTFPPGQEGLLHETEVVAPVAAGAVPNSGVNFEFTADGFLRLKHETSATFHTIWTWDGLQIVVNSGVASNPGVFAPGGNNYRFISNQLQWSDASNGLWYTMQLVGPHGNQQLELI